MFVLDERLAADCIQFGKFPVSILLLMNDANYPWFILVPRREGLSELHDLGADEAAGLMKEISTVSKAVARAFEADKMNVAALGNVVSQLHVHVIARFRKDPAWPGPVWGKVPARPYSGSEAAEIRDRLTAALGPSFSPTG